MKFSARKPATTLRTVRHLAAVLAVIAAFSLLASGAARAQSETGPTPTPTATAPAAPRLTATASGNAVELSWTAVPGASRYELHAQLVDDPGWQRLDAGDLTAASHTHRDLVPGKTYQYAVRALDAAGQPLGDWSNFPTATASASGAPTSTPTPTPTAGPTPTPTPTPPASTATAPQLTATASGAAIQLSWTSVPGATRYVLYAQRVDNPGWQRLDAGDLTATSHSHRDLVPGKTYQYAVRAIDANGQPLGDWSNYPTATAPASGAPTSTPTPTPTAGPTPTPTPTPPASTVAAPRLTATASGAAIELSWTAVPGATRYVLYAQRVDDPGWQRLDAGDLTATSHSHRDLVPGKTYQYAVRALDAAGQPLGDWSNYPTATAPASGAPTSTPTPTPTAGPTPTPTPTPPASTVAAPRLTATASGAAIELSWTAVPGATRYVLYAQRVDDPGWQRLDAGDLTATSHSHRDLVPGKTYQYAVRAIDASGQPLGDWSNYPTATAPASGAATHTPTATPTSTATAAGTPTPTPTVATTERGALIALYEATGGDNWYRNDNWLTDAPLDSWYGVTAEGPAEHVTRLRLSSNRLRGTLPDLRALANLKTLFLGNNELRGPLPDLHALANLSSLSLVNNDLSGPVPDLSVLAFLRRANLHKNRLNGPVFDLHRLTDLWSLRLENNDLSGPLPDANAFVTLRDMDLSGNRFCLPPGASLSHDYPAVDANLKSLDLPECTAAELAAYPAAPANLTAAVAGSRVALSWDAVAGASSYDLWVWDSLDRAWGPAAGALTGTSHTHSVLTDGRNYYFQVRARDAAGTRGPWSDRAHVLVVSQRYPPPPPSLELNIFYQKYLKVRGVIVTAPSEVTDAKMAQVGELVTGMYAGRPAYFEALSDNLIRIVIFKYTEQGGGVNQLPERRSTTSDLRGVHKRTFTGWQLAAAWDSDDRCYVLIHEFAHAIHSAIRDAPGGHAFDARVRALYEAAVDAGLWQNAYAGTNHTEYWADTVTFWFWQFIDTETEARGMKLEDYDPEIAKLIVETFTEDAYVPAYCKP